MVIFHSLIGGLGVVTIFALYYDINNKLTKIENKNRAILAELEKIKEKLRQNLKD